jgi:hypothetical protein
VRPQSIKPTGRRGFDVARLMDAQSSQAPAAAAAAAADPPFVLRPVGVPGNGDCLFYAVARILIDWLDRLGREQAGGGDPEPAVPPSPDSSSPDPPSRAELDEVARYLRGRVAARVLDPKDDGCAAALSTWWRLWADACREKDAEMMTEMRHMQGVAGWPPAEEGSPGRQAAPLSLSLADRRLVFRNMMNPGIYWGDEFALRSLEAVLGCRLCVVNEHLRVVKREHGADETTSLGALLPADSLPANHRPFLGLLILAHAHYEPLSGPGGVLAWDMAALPGPLDKLVTQWLGAAAATPRKL